MANKLFLPGLPTDIDVRLLLDTFGVPKEGEPIAYDTVAALIKQPAKSNRYRSVTGVWRRRLVREHNVYMKAADGYFTVMDPPTRVDFGASKFRSGQRALRRSHIVVESTDRTRLNAEQKARADHIQMVTATSIQAARVAANRPVVQLPDSNVNRS